MDVDIQQLHETTSTQEKTGSDELRRMLHEHLLTSKIISWQFGIVWDRSIFLKVCVVVILSLQKLFCWTTCIIDIHNAGVLSIKLEVN